MEINLIWCHLTILCSIPIWEWITIIIVNVCYVCIFLYVFNCSSEGSALLPNWWTRRPAWSSRSAHWTVICRHWCMKTITNSYLLLVRKHRSHQYVALKYHVLSIWPILSHFPDTIRKMKNDFKKMEDEMDCLSANMAAITEFSARISGTLQDQHAQITKLSGEY